MTKVGIKVNIAGIWYTHIDLSLYNLVNFKSVITQCINITWSFRVNRSVTVTDWPA